MLVSPPAGPAKPGTLLGNTTNPFLSCATAADHATKRVTVRASQLSRRLIVALDEYQRPNTPDTIADLPRSLLSLRAKSFSNSLLPTRSEKARSSVFLLLSWSRSDRSGRLRYSASPILIAKSSLDSNVSSIAHSWRPATPNISHRAAGNPQVGDR
jgi:hypothetical protein